MCGIAGASRNLLGDNPERLLGRMNEAMLHRGPDMGEIAIDDHFGLCHRRLSIIDLSEDGRQPMSSRDGRYIIVFNGEIYNFQELRKELIGKGYEFHSRTDTEVLLALYADQGPKSLQKIRGMYAYAIWDNKKKELFAARDRIGKKPFYYYHQGNKFAFASELKSILELDEIPIEVDNTAILDYCKYLYIPHPKSIYKNICKLEPGHYLLYKDGQLKIKEYWDIDFSSQLSDSSPVDLEEELLQTVREAVECRLISDVPLGAFLSGGVDSSAIVALMARTGRKPVTTCTIGFDDKEHNEAEYAKDFAEKLGSRHYEQYIQDEPAEIIKKLVWHFDEPFADSSMVPTYYVSKMARQHVTVALSGDGGDESFAGYEKYTIDSYENRVRQLLPAPLLGAICDLTHPFMQLNSLKRLNSLCSSACLDPADAFYVTNTFLRGSQAVQIFSDNFLHEVDGYDPAEHTRRYYRNANGEDHLSKILYTDLKLFLPGDILVKVDRMSMANSLEVRSPLLDHKVIEFAARVPSGMKINKGEKKFLLKETFRSLLGNDVLRRKKHGFTVPLDQWFRSDLKEMAASAIFEGNAMPQFFSMPGLTEIWEQHQQKKFNHGTLLWSVFMFALWLEMKNLSLKK
ncbi:MAG: asparagine synthase (glutamine-hydrolyzing) [Thermodesulfobacteriota bacterium]|nr:asparagine synthase (glutamine-hydrolyzing) [Thermodesulfobacteriota bacterium]